MTKSEIEDAIINGRLVIITAGRYKGIICHPTWCDAEFVRVTPTQGNPLASRQLKHCEIAPGRTI